MRERTDIPEASGITRGGVMRPPDGSGTLKPRGSSGMGKG
jgi:hypothetical protein